MKSNQQWNNAMKNNQQGLQGKGTTTIQDTKIFFVGQPCWLTFLQEIFARGHWISNLNPEVDRRDEIIIAFGEDSIGLKRR